MLGVRGPGPGLVLNLLKASLLLRKCPPGLEVARWLGEGTGGAARAGAGGGEAVGECAGQTEESRAPYWCA